MDIKEILNSAKSGEAVSFKAVLADKKLTPKTGGGSFLSITLCDKEGRISTPVFDNVENLDNKLEIGHPYLVKGIINIWNGTTQLKNIAFRSLKEGEYEADEFVSSYEIPTSLIAFFKNTVNKLEEPWRSISMRAVGMDCNEERWRAFLTCPSAEKHHGNRIGGLFLHTLGVMTHAVNACNVYTKINMYGDINNVINKDRLICKSILHDIKKTDEYEYGTVIRRKPGVIGHIIDGVTYLNKINEECGNILNREQIEDLTYAILSHHGQYGPYEPKTAEDMILHLADMADAKLVGELEK